MGKIKALMKKSKFWKIYICAVSVFLCVLVVGLIIFSVWLSDYESSQNTVEVDKVMSLFENKQYDQILDKTDVVKTGFVDRAAYETKLKETAEGKKISYVKAFSYDRFASPSYIIKADDKNLCKVTLKKSAQTSKFGFSLYEFDYISDFSFADIKVVFLAPEGATPYINGKAVDHVFKKTLAKDQPAEAKYTLSSDPVTVNRYEISGLLAQPESVDVKDKEGGSYELKSNSSNEIVAQMLDITINAPSEFTVTVNGIQLGSKFMTESSQENAYIKYLLNESDKNALSLFNTYKVDQLGQKPEVAVKDKQGNHIECTYNSDTRTFDVGIRLYTLNIPTNYKVTVNGVDIMASETWLTDKNKAIEELKNIPDGNFTKPTMNVYKVAVITGNLTVDARNFNGDPVALDYNENSMTYSGNFAVPDASKDAYAQVAISGAKKYAGFMSNDIGMDAFLSQILRGTQMYKDMSEYRQYWYTDHDSTAFENVEAYDLKVYGENCFSCAVYFDYWIYGQRGKPDFKQKLETNTRIWYVKTNGQWYMSDIQIFDRVK